MLLAFHKRTCLECLQLASNKFRTGPAVKEQYELYGQENFTESMSTVRRNTITIAEDIPEESYSRHCAAF